MKAVAVMIVAIPTRTCGHVHHPTLLVGQGNGQRGAGRALGHDNDATGGPAAVSRLLYGQLDAQRVAGLSVDDGVGAEREAELLGHLCGQRVLVGADAAAV